MNEERKSPDAFVGLDDEVGIIEVLKTSVFGLWQVVNNLTRLHHFTLSSDAYIAVPGGIGTVLEVMMIWQPLQVRKLDNTPLILVGSMWQGLLEWCRTMMLRPGFELAGSTDLEIPHCAATGPEVIEILRAHHGEWQRRVRADR